MPTKKTLLITPEQYYLEVAKCPLIVWEKCFEDGYHSLRIDKAKGNDESDFEAWNILFIDFVNKIGLEPEFDEYLGHLKLCNKLMVDYILSEKLVEGVMIGDRFLLNKIKLLKIKIEAFEKTGQTADKITISAMLNKLSKMQGFKLFKKDYMVLEYFDLIKDYKKWLKE